MLRHIVVPIIPLVVLGFVVVFQFIPLPDPPILYAGPIVLVWLVIGLFVVGILNLRVPQILANSNRVYLDEGKEA